MPSRNYVHPSKCLVPLPTEETLVEQEHHALGKLDEECSTRSTG